MKLQHRLQEWLADRVSFVQYPNIRPADQFTRDVSRFGLRFKHAMSIGKRIDLALFSLLLLLVAIAACAVVGFALYCFLF